MKKTVTLAALAGVLFVGLFGFWAVRTPQPPLPSPPIPEPALQDPKTELAAALTKGKELEKQGKLAEAIPYLETAVELTPKVYGPNGLETFHARVALALRYQMVGHYADAGALYHNSLSISGDLDEGLTLKDARWRFLRKRLTDWTRQPPKGLDKEKLQREMQLMRQEVDQLDGELKHIRAFDQLLGLEDAEEFLGNRRLVR
jgi:hypothetical protein